MNNLFIHVIPFAPNHCANAFGVAHFPLSRNRSMKNQISSCSKNNCRFRPLVAGALLVCAIFAFAILIPFYFPQPDPDRALQSATNASPDSPLAIAPQPSFDSPPDPASVASAIPPIAPPAVLDFPVPAEVPQPPEEIVPIRVPILLYHYVRDVVYSRDITRYEMNVTPAIFEDQLKTLISDGYHFVTMGQVAAALKGSASLPEKPIVLTFDDGIVDVHTSVLPLLRQYQVSITAYLAPVFLDHTPYLSLAMARELADSGWVEIGSHSSHHLKLKTLSDTKAKSEIMDSKKSLEELLGVPVDTFAYPFGLYGSDHVTMAKEAGYQSAVTMIWTLVRDSTDPYLLPRLNIGEKTGKELLSFLKGFK